MQSCRVIVQEVDAMAYIMAMTEDPKIPSSLEALLRIAQKAASVDAISTKLIKDFLSREYPIYHIMEFFFGNHDEQPQVFDRFMNFIQEPEVRKELRGSPEKWRFYSSPACQFCHDADAEHVVIVENKVQTMVCSDCMQS